MPFGNSAMLPHNYNQCGMYTTMQLQKDTIKNVLLVLAAWLIALALVYMVIIKISILYH